MHYLCPITNVPSPESQVQDFHVFQYMRRSQLIVVHTGVYQESNESMDNIEQGLIGISPKT